MTGFILGRSTVQWMALIGATLNFVALGIGLFFPAIAATAVILLNALGGLSAVYIGFLANTGTTRRGTRF